MHLFIYPYLKIDQRKANRILQDSEVKSLLQSYRSANKEKGFMVKSDDVDFDYNNDDNDGGDDNDVSIIISLYFRCFRKDL